jgi:hypothetical protein
MKKLIILITVILFALYATAQSFNFNTEHASKHMAFAEAGVEYGIISKVGYASNTKFLKHHFIWGSSATLPFLKFDLKDYKLKTGFQVPVYTCKNWITSANIHFILRGIEAQYNTSFNMGYELGIKSGIYKNKWFLAAETGFDHAVATYIKNSEFYKTYYYYEAKDGWYSNTGGNIYYGLSTGFNIKKSDITFRFGKVLDRTFKSPNDFSVYLVFGYQYNF